MKIETVLSQKEIDHLVEPSDLRGWIAIFTTWSMILGSLTLVAWIPNVIIILFAMVIVGGRHLALAILMHECCHYSLFKTRWLNQVLGQWLCAYPAWNDLNRYRDHHIKHHLYTGDLKKDPDMGLVTPYPCGRKSYMRKLLRDLSGITGVKRIYAILLMDLGFITYTISTGAKRIDQTDRSLWMILKAGMVNLHGVFITNTCLFILFFWLGYPYLYLIWIASYLTTFSAFIRIRSIAEHACTPDQTNELLNTRTLTANLLARLTVAPHFVNYHLEHHLLMVVPYFNLPKLHKLLKSRRILDNACTARNYLEVMKLAIETR